MPSELAYCKQTVRQICDRDVLNQAISETFTM